MIWKAQHTHLPFIFQTVPIHQRCHKRCPVLYSLATLWQFSILFPCLVSPQHSPPGWIWLIIISHDHIYYLKCIYLNKEQWFIMSSVCCLPLDGNFAYSIWIILVMWRETMHSTCLWSSTTLISTWHETWSIITLYDRLATIFYLRVRSLCWRLGTQCVWKACTPLAFDPVYVHQPAQSS